MSKTKLFGQKETTNLFTNFLLAQSSILKGAVSGPFSSPRAKQLKIVLGSITQTATAIGLLIQHDLSNEAIMLARGFIEKVINYCYVLLADKDEYNNYVQYSAQKAFRKLDRKVSLSEQSISLSFKGIEGAELPKELQKIIEKFTSEKGKEKTRWTKMNIEKRLDLISKKSKVKIGLFMLAVLSIYEDASEALHGTFYGCAFHTGYHLPEFKHGDKKSAIEREQKNLSLLAVYYGSIITELLKVLNKFESIENFVSKAKHNTNHTLEIMKAVTVNK